MTSRPIKFTNPAATMAPLVAAGKIGAWNSTQAGYVRYLDVAARVWRDFIQFDAVRFEVSL